MIPNPLFHKQCELDHRSMAESPLDRLVPGVVDLRTDGDGLPEFAVRAPTASCHLPAVARCREPGPRRLRSSMKTVGKVEKK